MLIVTGVIEIEPGGLEKARKAAQEMVEATLQEDGCLIYEFSQILGSDTRFRVYEEWQDRTALEAHFEAPHMTVFRAALAEIGIVSREIYAVAGGQKQAL